MPILEGFRPPWNGQMPKMRLLLSKTKIGFRRMPYREVAKKSLSGFRKAFFTLEQMNYFNNNSGKRISFDFFTQNVASKSTAIGIL